MTTSSEHSGERPGGWYPGNAVDKSMPPRFGCLDDVIRANKASGYHWFCADTIRFFKSRFSDQLWGGKYFWSSEKGPDEVRRYTVRRANPDGTIATMGGFQIHGTRPAAIRAIQGYMNDETMGRPVPDEYGRDPWREGEEES